MDQFGNRVNEDGWGSQFYSSQIVSPSTLPQRQGFERHLALSQPTLPKVTSKPLLRSETAIIFISS
jgi:hypothetical protein